MISPTSSARCKAGASSAITQYFYNSDAYFRFVDAADSMGCSVPVVPGIMPITNYTQLARFSDACGAEIPRWIRRRLESFGDDRESIRAFGLDVVTDLCEQLLVAGAPGPALLHDEPGRADAGALATARPAALTAGHAPPTRFRPRTVTGPARCAGQSGAGGTRLRRSRVRGARRHLRRPARPALP